MMHRLSGLQSCQLIGRPLVRVTGCPAAMRSAGEAQTFRTPSTGASHEIKRPSGDNFALKNVGLSNSFRRGIRGRADIWSLSYFARDRAMACPRPLWNWENGSRRNSVKLSDRNQELQAARVRFWKCVATILRFSPERGEVTRRRNFLALMGGAASWSKGAAARKLSPLL